VAAAGDRQQQQWHRCVPQPAPQTGSRSTLLLLLLLLLLSLPPATVPTAR